MNRWASVNRAEAAGRDRFHFHRLHHLFPCDIKGPIKVLVKLDVKGCSGGSVQHQHCLSTRSSQTFPIATSNNSFIPPPS